jgi:hypothetical protein
MGTLMIGTATDCLSAITPDVDGVTLIGTTLFYLPGGMLVNRYDAAVQPVPADYIVSADDQEFTHITGAAGTDTILKEEGTGRFAKATGNARLSGMVNLSRFDEGVIVFDCLFIVDLD